MSNKTIIVFCLLMLVPAALLAQGITTASINGTVLSQSGEPLVGANVMAVHEPTGTVLGAASRSDGRFNIPGVKVGGPYTITVSYIGYKTAKQEDIYLALGQDLRANFTLVEEAVELAEIVTVAERDAILTASNTGTATHVTTSQIERLPTIQRSISDFTRLTPTVNSAAGGQSIAGKNNRLNNFQVDGAILNDAFGLSDSGTPGGQANLQPISLDAIAEFNVEVAPYDVRSGSFAGGLVSAITRSGTNHFEGSGYFFGRNESFVGDNLFGEDQPLSDFDDIQAGFRFGGPIKQNKAFFFVNAEIRQRNDPNFAAINDPSSPINFQLPQADIQRIIDITRSKYNFDAGGFTPFTEETNDVKLFARIDINLSNRHRLTLRHNFVDGFRDRGLSRSTSFFTLGSRSYQFDSQTNSTVAQLNSTFGNVANEARISFTAIREERSPSVGAFPHVRIDVGNGDIALGVDRFSQANALDQDIFEFTDNLMYFTGNHTLTFGTHNELINFNNLFIQDFFGNYEFDSIDDYEAGRPSLYSLSASKVPGVDKPIADWNLLQLGFYAQDEWKPSPKLNVTFGLRLDIPIMPDDPLANDLFANASEFGDLRTNEVPSGNLLWSPRFGFNYDVSDDRTTQIRGGAGIFAGRPPAVWLSNQYSNTGVDIFRIFELGDNTPDFVPDPNNQPVIGDINSPQTAEINVTDPDFKMPQVFRSNLAVDQQLPSGLVGTLEFLYSKNINDVLFRNLNLGDPNNPGGPTGTLPDGRPSYGRSRVNSNFTRVIVMDNTSEGRQFSFTAQVKKQLKRGPWKNFFGSLSYTFMDAKDVQPGRSSRSVSNWRDLETRDPNNPPLATSDFEVQHRILANLSYAFHYGRGFGTTVSLFYEGRSGAPFSYMFNDDINGDERRGNDLAFIPSGPEDLADPSQWAAINTFIQSDDALKDAQGKIFGRNAARAPWQNRLDLRIAQKIPSVRTQNVELTLDIFNFLNLLNKDWGEIRFANDGRSDRVRIFNGGYDANGKLDVTLRPTDRNGDGKVTRDDAFSVSDLASRWQIQLGVRYSF